MDDETLNVGEIESIIDNLEHLLEEDSSSEVINE